MFEQAFNFAANASAESTLVFSVIVFFLILSVIIREGFKAFADSVDERSRTIEKLLDRSEVESMASDNIVLALTDSMMKNQVSMASILTSLTEKVSGINTRSLNTDTKVEAIYKHIISQPDAKTTDDLKDIVDEIVKEKEEEEKAWTELNEPQL